jgi:hypothetical protein
MSTDTKSYKRTPSRTELNETIHRLRSRVVELKECLTIPRGITINISGGVNVYAKPVEGNAEEVKAKVVKAMLECIANSKAEV